ncbi:nicotinamidase, partial [Biomphalaria glabrata]
MDMQESFMFDGNAYIKGAENLVDAINDIRKYFSHLFDVVIFTQEQHPMLHVSFYPTYHCMRPGDIVELNYTLDGRLCRQHPNEPKWTIPDEHTVECDLEKGTHILVQQELYEPHNIERVLSGKYSSKIVSRLTTDCCNDVIVVRGQYHHLDSASAFYEKLNNVPTTLQSELKQRNIDTLFLVGIAIDLGIIQTVQYAVSQLNYEVYVVHDATVPYKRERLPMCEFTIPKMGAHLICMNDLYNIRPKKNVKEEKDKADKCGKCGKCPEGDTDK